MTYQILLGNNLDILPTLPDNSVDSIVTDPPYELGFMGKKWDSSGIAYSVQLWQQCLRVLKPGGHLLSFGGTRTYHRVAVAIEDAGFELRDSIAWLYGSGFPKSLDVSKAIDKQAGAEREVIGHTDPHDPRTAMARSIYGGEIQDGAGLGNPITAPATPEAQQWQGWGTALKPAFEPIVVARKPIEGTVANNVLKWGTGGLNIDASRINNLTEKEKNWTPQRQHSENPIQFGGARSGDVVSMYKEGGRWPANIILDPYTAELLDEQSGTTNSKATSMKAGLVEGIGARNLSPKAMAFESVRGHNDSGGASRFFYVSKASKRDRNEGIELNNHPTVKPTTLMEYLIKLVTPPGGVVLDPFTGSGSTGKAAILQGFDFMGIEMTEEYLPIIEGRLKHAEAMVAEAKEQDKLKENEVLF